MSVSAPGSQRNAVHSGLSEMPVFSPEFLVCGHLYTLTLLLHQAEYTGEQSRQVSGVCGLSAWALYGMELDVSCIIVIYGHLI